MDPARLNYFAIVAAALATFVVGGLWYSPALFGRIWQRETGLTEDQLKRRRMGMIFGTSFVLALLMAFNLAAFLGPTATLGFGVAAALAAGFGWVSLAMGVTYLFEAKSMKLWLIDAGYHTVSFLIMGLILAAWK